MRFLFARLRRTRKLRAFTPLSIIRRQFSRGALLLDGVPKRTWHEHRVSTRLRDQREFSGIIRARRCTLTKQRALGIGGKDKSARPAPLPVFQWYPHRQRRFSGTCAGEPDHQRRLVGVGQSAKRSSPCQSAVLHPDLGILDLFLLPPSTAAKPVAAIEQTTPSSPWQPTSTPEIEAFSLYSDLAAAVSRKRWISIRLAVGKHRLVAEHGENDAGRPICRPGHDSATRCIFIV